MKRALGMVRHNIEARSHSAWELQQLQCRPSTYLEHPPGASPEPSADPGTFEHGSVLSQHTFADVRVRRFMFSHVDDMLFFGADQDGARTLTSRHTRLDRSLSGTAQIGR